MKSNFRCDSGLSDSQFQKVNKYILAKRADDMEELGEWAKKQSMKNRYDSAARPPKRRKTFWNRLKDLFKG